MIKDKKKDYRNQESKRGSCIFYRSFYEAIRDLPEVNQLKLYQAIFAYSLDFEEMNLDSIENLVWTLIKPQLDANITKWRNGCKGGEHGKKGAVHGKKGGRPKKDVKNPPRNRAEIPPKNPRNENVYIDIHKDFHKQLKKEKEKHESWAEGLHMRFGLLKGSLPSLLTKFDGHLKVQEKEHSTIEEYKRHFGNWLGSQSTNGRLKEHQSSKVGAL